MAGSQILPQTTSCRSTEYKEQVPPSLIKRNYGHDARKEKPTPSLKFLGRLLQFTVLMGAFYDAVEVLKPGFSTVNFVVTDLLLSFVYLVWLLQLISGKAKFPSFSRNKSLYLFIFILLVPIAVGFAQGHVWQTILRDARVPYYFLLSLVVTSFIKNGDEGALRKLLTSFLFVGTISLLVGYAVYVFKIPIHTDLASQVLISGTMSRFFGYHSSHLLLLVCVLLLVNYLLSRGLRVGTKPKALFGLLVFIMGLCLTLIRGLFIGMVAGCVVSVLIYRGRAKGIAIVGMASLVLVAALLLQVASTETTEKIIRIPMVERYVSIVDPSRTTKNSRESAEGRLKAPGEVERSIREHPLLGMG